MSQPIEIEIRHIKVLNSEEIQIAFKSGDSTFLKMIFDSFSNDMSVVKSIYGAPTIFWFKTDDQDDPDVSYQQFLAKVFNWAKRTSSIQRFSVKVGKKTISFERYMNKWPNI
jgi:hypothetical protein